MAIEDLRNDRMMAHLIDSLEAGQGIQHYRRLVFTMVARHFIDEEAIVSLLARDPECDEAEARRLLAQVSARDYNPPHRNRILEWMKEQEFPICPDSGDPQQCNVYRDLKFPDSVYEKIAEYYDRKSAH
jgi:hypothetical protein